MYRRTREQTIIVDTNGGKKNINSVVFRKPEATWLTIDFTVIESHDVLENMRCALYKTIGSYHDRYGRNLPWFSHSNHSTDITGGKYTLVSICVFLYKVTEVASVSFNTCVT